jgi:membrane-bound lytic murein transglycosylase D
LIASVAALHLLRENKKILKSWDLAVTAYNSGTKHLVKARRELKVDTLEDILKNYSHPHLGFASKNFYAEFIALVHTLAYRDEIFPAEKDIPALNFRKLHLAIARCSFVPAKIKDKKWSELNPHLRKPQSTYPRGTLVVTYDMDDKRFLKLRMDQMSRYRPIEWQKKLLGNQSCSTR